MEEESPNGVVSVRSRGDRSHVRAFAFSSTNVSDALERIFRNFQVDQLRIDFQSGGVWERPSQTHRATRRFRRFRVVVRFVRGDEPFRVPVRVRELVY